MKDVQALFACGPEYRGASHKKTSGLSALDGTVRLRYPVGMSGNGSISREKRLEKALQANLARRKAQARARASGVVEEAASEDSSEANDNDQKNVPS